MIYLEFWVDYGVVNITRNSQLLQKIQKILQTTTITIITIANDTINYNNEKYEWLFHYLIKSYNQAQENSCKLKNVHDREHTEHPKYILIINNNDIKTKRLDMCIVYLYFL